jgi:hypothetical protein
MAFYIKILGHTADNSGAATAKELKILGILPVATDDATPRKSWTGNYLHRPKLRYVFRVRFEPFKTSDAGSQNTDDWNDLVTTVLNKPYIWLAAPTGPNTLPPRWAGTLPDMTALFSSPIAVVRTGSIELSDAWTTAEETIELEFTAKARI